MKTSTRARYEDLPPQGSFALETPDFIIADATGGAASKRIPASRNSSIQPQNSNPPPVMITTAS